MRVTINSVNIETVAKGRSRYSVATVSYTYNGEPRTQKVMSFANPTVFKVLQDNQDSLAGQEVDVTITKNAQNYNEWSNIVIDASGGVPTKTAGTAAPITRVGGSNFETPEERAKRQVYIIKQSSITAAISILEKTGQPPTVDTVKEVAQDLTDWVLGNEVEKAAG